MMNAAQTWTKHYFLVCFDQFLWEEMHIHHCCALHYALRGCNPNITCKLLVMCVLRCVST